MALNLPVQGLEFQDLKQKLIDYLKADPVYKDWNFEASGVSTQMNILAYNTHILGFYVKMLLDESFVDSAHTRDALLSHAKRTAYLPKGRRSARAEVKLSVEMDQSEVPANDFILIPRGTTFSGANTAKDTRIFNVIDDVVIKERTVDGSDVTFVSPSILVFEGALQTWRTPVDNSVLDQKFVIRDENLDVDTIRVTVRESEESDNVEEFNPARFTDTIDASAPVYFISTNDEGLYQIFFGDDVFGKKPETGNIVEVIYVQTNGLTGNGAVSFNFNSPGVDPEIDYHVGNFANFSTETLSPSSGGMEPEGIESLRFTIPNHYRRQNRLLTESDFRSVIIEEFRNIDSINVWGGEKHWQRDYGKIYCSIKPKQALYLTSAAKSEIKARILDTYGTVGTDIVFVDPDYINVDTTLVVLVDRRKSNKSLGDIEGEIIARAAAYNAQQLNTFGNDLNDIDLLNAVRGESEYIKSVYSRKVMSKNALVIYRSTGSTTFTFSNAVEPGTVKSAGFNYAGALRHFRDVGGQLYLYSADGQLFLPGSQGTVAYDSGLIEFKFPEFATITGYENTGGRLRFEAVPTNPDVRTELNNIVRIADIEVLFR